MYDTIITNSTNMPLPLAVWCAVDDYDHSSDEDTISVTTLMKPLRRIVLARQYKDSLKIMDVDNLIATSMGTALHDSVERAWMNADKAIKAMTQLGINPDVAAKVHAEIIFERRSTKKVGSMTISGKFDMVTGGRVCDIKSTSTWGWVNGSNNVEYARQMSLYKWLNEDIITDDTGTILYIFTDWSKAKSIQDLSYPQSRVQSKDFALATVDMVQDYVEHRVALIEKFMPETDQDKLPDCTREELWQEEDTYKYYKNPAKRDRATKNYSTLAEAEARKAEDGHVGAIVKFEGKAKACMYCPVANLCNQRTRLAALGKLA
jgi:hypothetical protein